MGDCIYVEDSTLKADNSQRHRVWLLMRKAQVTVVALVDGENGSACPLFGPILLEFDCHEGVK